MRRLRYEDLVWTPEDRATYAKWRRRVLVFYGCAGLILLATFGAYRLIKDGPGRMIGAITSAVMLPQNDAARPPQP